MKKAIILVFIFLISLNYVYGANSAIRHTFDTSNNITFHPTAGDEINQGMLHLPAGTIRSTGNYGRWILNFTRELGLPTTGCKNMTLNYQLNITGNGGDFNLFLSSINGTGSGGATPYDMRGGATTHDLFDGTNSPRVSDMGSHFNNVTIFFNCSESLSTQNYNIYLNGTFLSNFSNRKSATFPDFLMFAVDTPTTLWMDNLSSCNSTNGRVSFGCVDAVEDKTPPEITYYNLTNVTSGSSGCENWNTNKSNPCVTSAVAPTLQFNTSEIAYCAISGSSNSTALDLNYTDMGSSRQCTGDAAGEGTKNHLCTLTLQDELVYDMPYLFISCKDDNGNQNSTSTSGPLALNITGLENTARNSIESGIRNALSSGYTIYTEQKIYARNSADEQKVGTFNKVVKRLSKIWAFNRIGVSDSHVNMFNITPVLYTLEFANKTSVYIENQTAALINATK